MPSKQKLYIHGGFPKTASTAIQFGLARNQATLLERGYFYPYSDAEPYCFYSQHAPLAAMLYGTWAKWIPLDKHKTRRAAIPSFLRAVARHPDKAVIVSSEFFLLNKLSAETVENTIEHLKEFDITFVAYLRRQDDHIVSSYQQTASTYPCSRFDLDEQIAHWSGRYKRSIDLWRRAIGEENVVVRPFSAELLHSDGVLADFLSTVGCDPTGLEAGPRVNETNDIRTVAVLADINRQRGRATLRNEPERRSIKIAAKKNDAQRKDFRRPRLSAKQSEKVENAFRDENRSLVSDADYEAFFAPRVNDAPDLSFEIDAEEHIKTLTGIVLHLGAQCSEHEKKIVKLQGAKRGGFSKARKLRRRLFGKRAGSRLRSMWRRFR